MSSQQMLADEQDNCQVEEHHKWFFSMMRKFDELAKENELMHEQYIKESKEAFLLMCDLHRDSIMREFV